MTTFWQTYLDMVQILLDFVKSVGLPDWDLQLQSTENMLVWMQGYDRINYARHFTYYWAIQQSLCERHPSIYQEFQLGTRWVFQSTHADRINVSVAARIIFK